MSIRTSSGNPDPTANTAIKKVDRERQIWRLAWKNPNEKSPIRKDEAPTKTK